MFLNGGGGGVTWVLSVGCLHEPGHVIFFMCWQAVPLRHQVKFSGGVRGGVPFPLAITRGPGLFQEEDIQTPLKTQSKLNKQASPCHFLFFFIFLFCFLKCTLGSRGWKCLGPISLVSFLFQSEPSVPASEVHRKAG